MSNWHDILLWSCLVGSIGLLLALGWLL